MIISTDAEKLFNKTQHPACGYLMLMCGRNWHSVVEQLSFIKKTNRKKKQQHLFMIKKILNIMV